jgi:hypothetical protein
MTIVKQFEADEEKRGGNTQRKTDRASGLSLLAWHSILPPSLGRGLALVISSSCLFTQHVRDSGLDIYASVHIIHLLVDCYPTFWFLFLMGLQQGWAQLNLSLWCTNVDKPTTMASMILEGRYYRLRYLKVHWGNKTIAIYVYKANRVIVLSC